MAIFSLINKIAGWGSNEELFGRKPDVPEAPTSTQIGADLLKANQANLPEATRLAAATNAANTTNYQAALRAALPGYDALVRTSSANALSAARGELPKDVSNLIQRKTAERALTGGYQGSQVADWSAAQNLGLTSLDVQSTFDTWLKRAQQLTTPGFMDVSSMFISPEQQIGISNAGFSRDMLAASVAAAPDPAKRGVLDLEMGILGEILGAYSGGAGYQQTYRPNYGSMGGGGNNGYENNDYSGGGGGSGGFLKSFGFGGSGGTDYNNLGSGDWNASNIP